METFPLALQVPPTNYVGEKIYKKKFFVLCNLHVDTYTAKKHKIKLFKTKFFNLPELRPTKHENWVMVLGEVSNETEIGSYFFKSEMFC